jgi:hypothetical protein
MTKWRKELRFSIKDQKYGDALYNWPVMVIIIDGYLGFLLISILVCHIVSFRKWVVLWVKVMALHGSWPNKVYFKDCPYRGWMMVL